MIPRTEAGPWLGEVIRGGKPSRAWFVDVFETSKQDACVVLCARSSFPIEQDTPTLPTADQLIETFRELHREMDKGNI